MSIVKSNMTVNGNSVHMSMPFAKVDKEQRLVSGYATLDNVDSQGDIVLSEASAKAFARARGNIREMHQPLAVGRMVDFREDEFFDAETNKFYRGIFVTARVSEGAEDTWKKVLDGTLTGFSIGGEINEASNEFVKEAGKTIRFIKDYDLVELSLVDNPANQLANVLSIQKAANGSVTVKGMAVETAIESVFICPADSTVLVKNADSESCPQCGIKMENAGWFETGANREEKVRSIVTKFLSPTVEEAAPNSESEGGVEMGKNDVTKSDAVPEATPTEVVNPSERFPDGEKIEEEAKSDDEKAADEAKKEDAADVDETSGTEETGSETPDEVVDEETEISKKIDELHTAVKDSLEKSHSETQEQVVALEKKLNESTETILNKVSELEVKWAEFGEKIETQKNRLAEMEGRLEKMNSSEAIKKSVDLENEAPTGTVVQKSSWNGAFSGKSGSGFSVDNLT